jgi:molybdenum cofactor biosynthesis enzyme MoaA
MRVTPKQPKEPAMQPYLTISLTEVCNMRCVYCPPAGETYHTARAFFAPEKVLGVARVAVELGLRKIRLSGGEPSLYPHLREVVEGAAALGLEVHLNTNGLLLKNHLAWLEKVPGVRIKVSLDACTPEVLRQISGVGRLDDILEGLRLGAQKGLVQRLNFVLTRLNADQLLGILQLCRELQVGLKIFDMFPVPETREAWQNLYFPTEALDLRGESLPAYEYAAHFGTPTRELLIDGVPVRVKNCLDGTRYHLECASCPFFPCPEGLYCLMVTPSLTVVPCRLGAHLYRQCADFEQFKAAIGEGLQLYAESYFARLYTAQPGIPVKMAEIPARCEQVAGC